MIQFFQELRRRNIFRVAGVYAVVSWLIIQIGVAILPTFEAPPWVLKTLILFIAVGFPVAMIFAWAFELTPTGVRPTQSVSAEDSIRAMTARKLDYAIIAGLLLVAGLIFMNGVSLVKPNPTSPDSVAADSPSAPLSLPQLSNSALPGQSVSGNMVAVLPFVNRSPRDEDAYFADGIHDDLLTQLSKISALQVISRTSVMRYADTDIPIPEIATTLGVGIILEGAVQRAGDRVRITVQLIDAIKDTHLWAESYNRELTTDNIFDIQEEITLAVAEATEAVLTSAELAKLQTNPTDSLEAYDAFIRGQLLSRSGVSGTKDYAAAIKSFDTAIATDPDFAAAYAGKAYAALYLYWLYGRDASHVDVARASLEKAQELAPDAIETLIAEAYYNYWGLQDYALADATLDKALTIAPNNPEAWAIKAYVARRAGRFEEAITGLEKSHRLDPLTYITVQELANTYSELGYFDKARVMMERAKEISPTSQWTRAYDAHLWWQRGNAAKAWETINVTVANPDTFYFKQMIFHAVNTRDPDKIKFALDLWPEDRRGIGAAPETYAIMKATAHLALGQTDEAKAELKAIRARIKASDAPYPSAWSGNAAYHPVTVPGLSGDLRGVNAAIRNYKKINKADAWAERDVLFAIALAYARADDPDTAFTYVSQLEDKFGPGIFLRLSIIPAMDPYREHPAYVALKSRFEANN